MMQKCLWRVVLAALRASCAPRQKPQCYAGIRKFLKESPSVQTIALCKQTKAITSLFLAIAASQALVETVSLCILKQQFPPLSLSVYKSSISKDLFLQSGAHFFFCSFSLCFLSCALLRWRCLNLWRPFSSIPMTGLYLMSLKMHALPAGKKGGKAKIGKQMWQINWVEMELPLHGERKQCAHWVAELL